MTDPPRIVDLASGGSPKLRELVEACRRDMPTDNEVAALEARLGPILGPSAIGPDSATGAAGGAGAGGAAGGWLAKVGIAVTAAVGLTTGAVWLAGSSASRHEAPTTLTPPPGEKPHAERAAAPTGAEPPPPAEEPQATKPPPPSSRPSGTRPPTEAELLEAARAALQADAQRALALVREHGSRYPSGVLAQEREVIAIEALKRLGRVGDARRRAEQFDRAYPGSAHKRKVDGIVE